MEDYKFYELNAKEFEYFASREERSFLQTQAMAKVLEHRGFTIKYFAVA